MADGDVVYALLEDGDLTMHSSPELIGVALLDEAEALVWKREGQWRAVVPLRVYADRAAVPGPTVRRQTREEQTAELHALEAELIKAQTIAGGGVVEVPLPRSVAEIVERMRVVQDDLACAP